MLAPCISNPYPTGTRRPPSCCGRAIATAARSKARIAKVACSHWPTEYSRRTAHAVQGRKGRGGRSGGHRGAPRVAARACGGRARHAARHRSRSSAWACRQPLPRPRHRDDCGAADRRLPSSPPPACSDPLTAAFSLGEALGWERSTRTSFMSPSTGWASARRRSRRRLLASICAPARWCCTAACLRLWRRCYKLAQLADRNGKKGKLQIVWPVRARRSTRWRSNSPSPIHHSPRRSTTRYEKRLSFT